MRHEKELQKEEVQRLQGQVHALRAEVQVSGAPFGPPHQRGSGNVWVRRRLVQLLTTEGIMSKKRGSLKTHI